MDYAQSLIYRNKRILRDKCKNVYLFYLACYIILIFEINSDISRYESLRELKAQHANTVVDVAEACIVYTLQSFCAGVRLCTLFLILANNTVAFLYRYIKVFKQ